MKADRSKTPPSRMPPIVDGVPAWNPATRFKQAVVCGSPGSKDYPARPHLIRPNGGWARCSCCDYEVWTGNR